MKKLSIYLAAALCLAMAYSCKDDEETVTKPSLSGLYLDGGIAYVAKGETQHYTIDASSLTTSGDEMPVVIGLSWQANSAAKETLTDDIKLNPDKKTFSYRADTLGTYTITCYAFTPDDSHYSASASSKFQAIDPATALTGIAGTAAPGKYLSVTIGALTWMAENLHETASGAPYQKCEVMNTVFGRYYTYEEALTACPAGWRLPTAAEWDALGTDSGKLMADASFMDSKLWAYCKEVNITNETGFNAIPVGYLDKSGYYTTNVGEKEYAAFWTSDSKDDKLAHYRYIFGTNPVVQKGEGSRTSLALSVRCVK